MTTQSPSPSVEQMLPHSMEAERIVIGSMMLDAGVCKRYATELIAEMFYWKPHATIFDVLKAMLADGQPIEPPSVTQELANRRMLEAVGGPTFVTDLFLAVPTTATVDHYAEIVTEMHMRRMILDTAHQAEMLARDPAHNPVNAADSLRLAFQMICSANALRTCADLKPLADYESEYRDFVEQTASGKGAAVDLGRWFPSLRKCGGGVVVGGELITLVADTGVGKTALASSLAMAVRPHRVAYFQLELPSNLAFPRFIQSTIGKSLVDVFDAYRQGRGTGWGKHPDLAHIWLSVRSGLSVRRIQQRVESLNATLDRPFDVVIVDYFQLLRGQGKTRYERYSNEAEDAKIAAKETNAVWVLLSQVRRPEGDSDEKRLAASGRTPSLHDAKESGSIENSTGLMLGFARADDQFGPALECKVTKSTKGGAGSRFTLNYHLPTLRITERSMADEYTRPPVRE